jgi:hypothetical protein
VKTKGDKPVNPRAGFSITASGDKLVFLGYDMSLSDKLMEVYVLDTGTIFSTQQHISTFTFTFMKAHHQHVSSHDATP